MVDFIFIYNKVGKTNVLFPYPQEEVSKWTKGAKKCKAIPGQHSMNL